MIRIRDLTKIYRSKKKSRHKALSSIDLTLPDTGLVFVLGKSGSGKSTLLNLIGGLDSITSGTIEVDGNDLSSFSEHTFCNYRNNHVGFIFQDYHLIDELTVFDNIALSLDLRRVNDKEKVLRALDKVQLSGYENRYPQELSGGEQQRVAIARALVKDPRIILADEPTGNLDTNTATAVLEILKELSKNCLILIVSHNINDANTYADRIIELRHGKIVSDRTRNPEFLDQVSLDDGKLIYPQGLSLSNSDIELINANSKANLVLRTDKFLPTQADERRVTKRSIDNKNLTIAKSLSVSGKFLKNKAFAISASAFMVSVIMVIMALAQTIIDFDANRVLQEEIKKSAYQSLLLNKVVGEETQEALDRKYHNRVANTDIQSIYDAGYNGKIYPVLNVTVPVTMYLNSAGRITSYFASTTPSIFITESLGTIVVDEAFFEKKFGGINYLAKLDEFQPHGLIITDYVADSIIAATQTLKSYGGIDYESLLGAHTYKSWSLNRVYINAVIDTGYRERHADFLDRISNGAYSNRTEIYEDEGFGDFSSEIYDSLGYSYSLNPNFAEDYTNNMAYIFPWRQKITINGKIAENTSNYILCGTARSKDFTTLVGEFRYNRVVPTIPEGAKYIRVASGYTAKPNKLSNLEFAKLTFSNGYTVPKEIMQHESGVMLNSSTGLVNRLGMAYEKNTVSDYIEIPEGSTITEFVTYTEASHAFCAFYDENKNFISSFNCQDRTDLKQPASITMTVEEYNLIFDTNYSNETLKDFVPHKATLAQYALTDAELKDPLFTMEVTILELKSSGAWSVSKDVADAFADSHTYAYSLYLDGADGIAEAIEIAKTLNFEYQSITIEGISTMTKAVNVFVPLFELVAIFLYLGVIFILVNFASKMINDKMHDIGILKALGTKNKTIGIIFGLQMLLVALLTCLMSTAGYFFFIDFANDVLFESMHQLVPNRVVLDLEFFTFVPRIAFDNCILISILTFISLIPPMLKIKMIKPVKIIKAKE